MKNHKAACELADKALQEALDKIDELEEDDFRDAKSIIELLKENLTLWKEEEEEFFSFGLTEGVKIGGRYVAEKKRFPSKTVRYSGLDEDSPGTRSNT